MTSVEIPYSIAAALPTLAVLDITNEVAREVAAAGPPDGIAFVSPTHASSIVRLSEREDGIFTDVEDLLMRLIAPGTKDRERLLLMLLGARTEQLPFHDGDDVPRHVPARAPVRIRRRGRARLATHDHRLSLRWRSAPAATCFAEWASVSMIGT